MKIRLNIIDDKRLFERYVSFRCKHVKLFSPICQGLHNFARFFIRLEEILKKKKLLPGASGISLKLQGTTTSDFAESEKKIVNLYRQYKQILFQKILLNSSHRAFFVRVLI